MSFTRRDFLGAGLGGFFLAGTDASAATGLQYIVTDANGAVLDAQGSQRKRHPASLTKMMTLYCVMAAMKDPSTDFDFDSSVRIPGIIGNIPKGIAVFENLKPGQTYPASKLLIGAGSRSDAYSTLSLALHLADRKVYDWQGSEQQKLQRFIDVMNKTAAALGMKDSHFSVCTGLPAANHYSTPRDIAILMRALQETFPKSSALAMGHAEFDITPLSNAHKHSSKFLRRHDSETLFAKTGWTNDAGYCLAVASDINGKRVTSIIFGADGDDHRNNIMETLLDKIRVQYVAVPVPTQKPG